MSKPPPCLTIGGRKVVTAHVPGDQVCAYFADCQAGEPIAYGSTALEAAQALRDMANSYQADAIASAQSAIPDDEPVEDLG